jgi:hypothetical protein
LVGGELEKFKVDCVPGKAEATSGVKSQKQELELPVAPESGHNST